MSGSGGEFLFFCDIVSQLTSMIIVITVFITNIMSRGQLNFGWICHGFDSKLLSFLKPFSFSIVYACILLTVALPGALYATMTRAELHNKRLRIAGEKSWSGSIFLFSTSTPVTLNRYHPLQQRQVSRITWWFVWRHKKPSVNMWIQHNCFHTKTHSNNVLSAP